jgi:hypothetical protein
MLIDELTAVSSSKNLYRQAPPRGRSGTLNDGIHVAKTKQNAEIEVWT